MKEAFSLEGLSFIVEGIVQKIDEGFRRETPLLSLQQLNDSLYAQGYPFPKA